MFFFPFERQFDENTSLNIKMYMLEMYIGQTDFLKLITEIAKT